MNYLDKQPDGPGMDLSDTITRVCPCGSEWFFTVVTVDADYELAGYGLDGQCVECGTRVKLPCPEDKQD